MTVREITKRDDWDRFLTSLPQSLFFQSWAWGELRRSYGWQVTRLQAVEGGKPLGAMQLLTRRIAPGLTLAYAPQGPALDWNATESRAIFTEIVTAGEMAAKADSAFVLRADPFVEAEGVARTLTARGFKKSFEEVQARHSIYLDLTKNADELMTAMPKKGRYSINYGRKAGVEVKEVSLTDGLPRFHALYAATAKRLKFPPRPKSYFEQLAGQLTATGSGTMIESYYRGKHLTSSFIVFFGTYATYLYAASSAEHRELSPNYLAQWQAILSAKQRGAKVFDMWGITKTHDPSHTYAGYTHFKRQFGGREISYIGAYDKILSRPKYISYKTAQRLRRLTLGIESQ